MSTAFLVGSRVGGCRGEYGREYGREYESGEGESYGVVAVSETHTVCGLRIAGLILTRQVSGDDKGRVACQSEVECR